MPRTTITAVPADQINLTSYASVTWTPADVGNGNATPSTGRQELWIRNVNAASPPTSHRVTLHTTAGTMEFTIAGKTYGRINAMPDSGFKQTDGNIWFEADDSEIEFAVVNRP